MTVLVESSESTCDAIGSREEAVRLRVAYLVDLLEQAAIGGGRERHHDVGRRLLGPTRVPIIDTHDTREVAH